MISASKRFFIGVGGVELQGYSRQGKDFIKRRWIVLPISRDIGKSRDDQQGHGTGRRRKKISGLNVIESGGGRTGFLQGGTGDWSS